MSPWALTLTEPVLEAFELPASDWPEKCFFWPISEEEQTGDSDVFLHNIVFLIDRPSCVARAVEMFRSRATNIEMYLKMRAWRCILYTMM